MAFDGHQTTVGNSPFQTYQRQVGAYVNGRSGFLPGPFIPDALTSRSEHSAHSWSQESQDDQFEFGYAQTAIKNRKPTDASCDSEADLQGLVSNILDEADSQDSFYSERLPTCNPIWSPKTLKEELLQYFQPEPKTFSNSSFFSSHLPHETLCKAQQSVDKEVNELSQLSSGLAGNQQWSFNLPNGNSSFNHPQKLPPGLPLSNKVTADLPQIQQYRHISMAPFNSRGNDSPSKTFPGLHDIFRPQNDAKNPCLDDLRKDNYSQKCVNLFFNEHYAPEDMSQLVSSFQSFVTADHDSNSSGSFPNVNRLTVDMLREGLAQQCRKVNNPAILTQKFQATQTQKQLFGHLELIQNGRFGEVRNKNVKLDDPQEIPEFSSEHLEYFQKPKAFPSHQSFPHQRHNKVIMQGEHHNLGLNQHSKHYNRQSQKKIKPPMEKENRGMQMPGFVGEGFTRRQQTNTHMAEEDKELFSQNQYFEFQRNMHSQKRDGENTMISSGNVQQFPLLSYSLNDPKRHSGMGINPNLSSTLPGENSGSHTGMNGMRFTNDTAAFNSLIGDMKNLRGESTYHGMPPSVTASLMLNQGGPALQPLFYLDECYEQCKSLEKERKKIEIILKKTFPGKRTTMMTNISVPKTPPRPTRVDHLIIDMIREQTKVATLLDKLEYFCGVPLHINIHAALKSHQMAVCISQTRCKEDSGNRTKQQQQGVIFTDDRDNLMMIMALRDLAASTKRLRTALWCAFQMTLPKPANIQDHDAHEEAASAERCSSPFQGYSFSLMNYLDTNLRF